MRPELAAVGSVLEIAGIVAGLLALAAAVPYTIAIFKRETVPNRASWFVWAVMGWTLLWFHIHTDAQFSLWLPLVYAIGPTWIAVLSIKYGTQTWTTIDVLSIMGASVAWGLWLITNDNTLSLLCAIGIDSFGTAPTVVKAYLHPETEDRSAWIITAFASAINLLAIADWHGSEVLYPAYISINTALIAVIIAYRSYTQEKNI